MKQWEVIRKRLQNPSVIVSIVSQIVALLVLFKVQVDMDVVTGVITAITSILVLLGILANPDTKSRGYGDDFALCANCNEVTQHVVVGDQLVCKECGSVHTEPSIPIKTSDTTKQ